MEPKRLIELSKVIAVWYECEQTLLHVKILLTYKSLKYQNYADFYSD